MTFFRGMRKWSGLLACLLALTFPCPAFSNFGEFTIRDELELARKFDLIIETRFPVVHDTRITAYVQSLVDRLVAAMPPQPFPASSAEVISMVPKRLARRASRSAR